jgi:hypothetical protein
MLRLENGRFTIIRTTQQQKQQSVQTPVQDVVQTVEVPIHQETVKPDPSTYMVLSVRKIDGVTVKTVSDRKTGNVFILTDD